MTREALRHRITSARITAIIRLDDLTHFLPLTQALLAGGIRSLEFTLTNADALTVVEQVRQRLPIFDAGEAVIGVGSIRTPQQAQAALDAGAQLLVAPVFVPEMVTLAHKHQVVCAPGGYTPGEIETIWQAGADFVKVFPANGLGPAYMKAVLAPMPDLRLMPTGGIDLSNLAAYLNAGVSAVGIGTALVSPQMIAAQDWQGLEALAHQYTQAVASL